MFAVAAANIVDAAEVLERIVTSGADRKALNARRRDIEHANDENTHEVMRRLNSTFVTPFDREDIPNLASRLDDVVDVLEAAADLIVLYELDEVPATTWEVVGLLVAAARVTAEAMPRLQSTKDLALIGGLVGAALAASSDVQWQGVFAHPRPAHHRAGPAARLRRRDHRRRRALHDRLRLRGAGVDDPYDHQRQQAAVGRALGRGPRDRHCGGAHDPGGRHRRRRLRRGRAPGRVLI
jgi:hypothetical protein